MGQGYFEWRAPFIAQKLRVQGCQIFLGITDQNGKNTENQPQNIPSSHRYVEFTKWP
jgi:hypothetical protein